MRELNHRFRYQVEYNNLGKWYVRSSSRYLRRAKKLARYGESLGVFQYRVVDTEDE